MIKITLLLIATLACVAATTASAAEEELPLIQMEAVCTPIRTSRVFQKAFGPNPRGGWNFIGECMNYKSTGGKEKVTIQLDNGRHYLAYADTEVRPEAEWVILDLATGVQKIVKLPGFHAAEISGGGCLAGNGRVFFSVDYGHIYYYEPTEETIKILGRVNDSINVLRQFYRLELGPDGMVYGSSQSTNGVACVIRINPDTLDYTFITGVGVPGRRNLTYGYYIGIEPPWLYVAVGQGQWELWAVNFETGEKTMLAERIGKGARVVVSQGGDFCVAQLHGDPERVNVALRDGKIVASAPHGNKFDVTPEPKTFKQVEWKQTRPMEVSKPPVLDRKRRPVVVGEGQGILYWAPAGTQDWREGRFVVHNIEAPAMESATLMPDGSILGSSQQYHGWWRYAPGTAKQGFLSRGGPSGAKTTICDGKLYFAGYPNTSLYVYDPARPWTVSETGRSTDAKDNPRFIASQGQGKSEAHHAIALATAKGRVYTLGLRERWATGAGLCRYDPATGEFVALGQANKDLHPLDMITMPALDRLVVSGRTKDAQLRVYDLDLKEVGTIEVKPGLTGTGYMQPVDEDRFIGWYVAPEAQETTLYVYDLRADKLLRSATTPGTVVWVLRRDADGTFWLLNGEVLSRLDPATLKTTPVGTLAHTINMPTRGGSSVHRARPFWRKNSLFGAHGGTLYESPVIK